MVPLFYGFCQCKQDLLRFVHLIFRGKSSSYAHGLPLFQVRKDAFGTMPEARLYFGKSRLCTKGPVHKRLKQFIGAAPKCCMVLGKKIWRSQYRTTVTARQDEFPAAS